MQTIDFHEYRGQTADLRGADLDRADLRGSAISAGHDRRGYHFLAVRVPGPAGYEVHAGCRVFTPAEAEAHWASAHGTDPALRAECQRKLRWLAEGVAAAGWA